MQLDDQGLSPQTLADLIATGRAPLLIDVTTDEDFNADPALIPGAVRQGHRDISAAGPCVVICQKGRKLSQGGAALLRATGVPGSFLIGGNHGWRDAGLPRISPDGPARWVIAGVTVECLVLSSLAGRFLPDKSRILIVDRNETEAVAEKFDARVCQSSLQWLEAVGLDTPTLSDLVTEAESQETRLFSLLAACFRLPDPVACAAAVLDAAYADVRKEGHL